MNSLVVDRRERVLFSGGSDHFVRMFCLVQSSFPELKNWKLTSDVIHLRFSRNERFLAVGKFVYNSKKELILIETGKLFKNKSE